MKCHNPIISQPRVLNLILINLILSCLIGAAIIGPANTKYIQNIIAYWEKLLKIVKIALLQYNYELSRWNMTFDNNYEWLNDFI